jgi:hypothetical protein
VLAEPKIGKGAVDKVMALCWKIDEAANVSEVMKALEMPR